MKNGHAALIFRWIILFPSYIQSSQHRGTGTCGAGVLHSDAAERVGLDGGRQVHFAHNVGIVRIWKGQHILYLSSQGVPLGLQADDTSLAVAVRGYGGSDGYGLSVGIFHQHELHCAVVLGGADNA